MITPLTIITITGVGLLRFEQREHMRPVTITVLGDSTISLSVMDIGHFTVSCRILIGLPLVQFLSSPILPCFSEHRPCSLYSWLFVLLVRWSSLSVSESRSIQFVAEGKRWKKKAKKLPGVESCLALRTGLFSLTTTPAEIAQTDIVVFSRELKTVIWWELTCPSEETIGYAQCSYSLRS